ncbi:MAG TPA: hypothetical protein VL966_03070 [Alphaproteobacteria bacterium]|nr:hypothetical protein [Alphaproteobacteria bacterium]
MTLFSLGARVALAFAVLLSLGACEAMRHDRGVDSCYCYSDVTGSSTATVGHRWRL